MGRRSRRTAFAWAAEQWIDRGRQAVFRAGTDLLADHGGFGGNQRTGSVAGLRSVQYVVRVAGGRQDHCFAGFGCPGLFTAEACASSDHYHWVSSSAVAVG